MSYDEPSSYSDETEYSTYAEPNYYGRSTVGSTSYGYSDDRNEGRSYAQRSRGSRRGQLGRRRGLDTQNTQAYSTEESSSERSTNRPTSERSSTASSDRSMGRSTGERSSTTSADRSMDQSTGERSSAVRSTNRPTTSGSSSQMSNTVKA
ncbi:hypothetical protein H0X06_04780 [Candidatus Dependentiae bacterium]|nr:hypothetical protein [Candidatus Dependentiae bacterium]